MSAETPVNPKARLGKGLLIVVIILLVVLAGLYVWYHYSAHKATTANQKKQVPVAIVDNTTAGPADLVSFLKQNLTGCLQTPSLGSSWYSIVKVGGSQAMIQYGCQKDGKQTTREAYAVAKKTGNTWEFLIASIPDEWAGSIPSCTIVNNDNKISQQIAPKCWTGSRDAKSLTTQPVTNP